MSYENNSIYWVEVDRIAPNPYQPRKEFDEGKIRELSESIRMYGILQPLTVTRNETQREDGGIGVTYELIAGERRLRASKLAGLQQVPVIIRTGEESEREKLELAIIENLQREDLNAIDRARAFKQLAEEFKLTKSQVAKKIGRSREYVSNTLRLLLLPPHIIEAMQRGELSEGHGRTLLMLNDRPEEQRTLFRETLLKKLSVRDVERISRKIATDKVRKKEWHATDPELIEIEKQLTESLGTRVQIEKRDFGGKLVIDYFSPDDLRKILVMMQEQGGALQLGVTQEEGEVQQEAHSEEEKHLEDATPLAFESEAAEADSSHAISGDAETVMNEPASAASPQQESPEKPPADTPSSNTAPPKESSSKKETDEDSDLYAIKNFSL